MPRARRSVALVLLILIAGLCARSRSARADEVDDLIQLVQHKPAGMAEDQWKEERRDAATKLGKLGDKRAVPALIQVVQTESFDVVAENAIDALGKLGDKRAVPVLKQVAADDSRDRESRAKARKALSKLGAKAEPQTGDDDDDLGLGVVGNSGTTTTTVGASRPKKIPDGPAFSDDTLAATDRFTIAAGAAHLNYDTQRQIASLDGDVTGTYRHEIERKSVAYGYGADLHVTAGAIDLPGSGTASEALVLDAALAGDSRFYWNPGGIYGAVEGALDLSVTGVKVERMGPGNTTKELLLGANLAAAVGGGYGRQIDLGEALRLRRIEMALEDARALGRPITPDLAEKILRTWWALRGEVGAHDRLVATVSILREAGVLLGEPDASLTYRILQILTDGQLDHRASGLDVRLLVSESFLVRDDLTGVPDGRVETLLLRARYGQQMTSTVQELVGEAYARKRILAGMDPAPWAAAASAAWRRYVYSDHDDPIGAFEVRAELGASNDDTGQGLAPRMAGGIGWLWAPSRASHLRLSANAVLEGGEMFLGATFEGTYGFLDVGFVGQGAYGAVK